MREILSRLFGRDARQSRTRKASTANRFSPSLEAMEERATPSLYASLFLTTNIEAPEPDYGEPFHPIIIRTF